VDVDESLSPSLQEKVSYLGTLLKSFRQGETAIGRLLNMTLGHKRIERLTERIGAERTIESDAEIEHFQSLTLMEKLFGPKGVTAAEAVAVMGDGGRYQRTEKNAHASSDKTSHWYEYKAGLCLELGERQDDVARGPEAVDSCPDVPSFLLNVEQVETLTREIGHQAATVAEDAVPADESLTDNVVDIDSADSLSALESVVETAQASKHASSIDSPRELPMSPDVTQRDVVATSENSRRFGLKLAARAWNLGLFQAKYKAFVGDGSAWLWTIFATHFKAFGFTPIVDIIHAVTHLYAAATAGRPLSEGAPVYQQWVRWLWSGDLTKVIAALASRQDELGLPTDDDGETSPRRIVSSSLTYFQNQQSRMRYPEYRKLGLPITSSHMESAIKELNYRIKGTEKFWSTDGGESVLQLKSDTLSASDPLAAFWKNRHTNRTGFHANVRKRKPTQIKAAA